MNGQRQRRSKSRLFSATAFAGAALAFALPFGWLSSCDGEKVRFTGVELATFSVPADDSYSGTLHEKVERNAGVLALVTLLAAIGGFVVLVAGRRGGGIFASVGLLGIQLLAWAVLLSSDGGGNLLVGFWLALVLLATAAAVHLVRAVQARREDGSRAWRYAVGRTVFVLLPSLALLALLVAAVSSG